MTHTIMQNKYTWVYTSVIGAAILAGIATISYGMIGLVIAVLMTAMAGIFLAGYQHRANLAEPVTHASTGKVNTASFAQRTPMQPHIITTKEGDTKQAWVVPMEHMEDYTLVLTSEGYKVVDQSGRVIHSLS